MPWPAQTLNGELKALKIHGLGLGGRKHHQTFTDQIFQMSPIGHIIPQLGISNPQLDIIYPIGDLGYMCQRMNHKYPIG